MSPKTKTKRHVVMNPKGRTGQEAACGETVDGPWSVPESLLRRGEIDESRRDEYCLGCVKELERRLRLIRPRCSSEFATDGRRRVSGLLRRLSSLETELELAPTADSVSRMLEEIAAIRLSLGIFIRNVELELGRMLNR